MSVNSIDFCLRRPERGDLSIGCLPPAVVLDLPFEGIVGVVTAELLLEAEFPILECCDHTSVEVESEDVADG